MRKEIEQIYFDLEVIAFEYVSLNTRFSRKRILIMWCQYVNKHSQDSRYY